MITNFLLGLMAACGLSNALAIEGKNGNVSTAPFAFRNALLDMLIGFLLA
jgi:hypothetical protein